MRMDSTPSALSCPASASAEVRPLSASAGDLSAFAAFFSVGSNELVETLSTLLIVAVVSLSASRAVAFLPDGRAELYEPLHCDVLVPAAFGNDRCLIALAQVLTERQKHLVMSALRINAFELDFVGHVTDTPLHRV